MFVISLVKKARDGPGVKLVNGSFMVVGGFDYPKEMPTEKCTLVGEQAIECVSQEPSLLDYDTPELFLVPDNFCQE